MMEVGSYWRWTKKEDTLEPSRRRLGLGVSLGSIGKAKTIKRVALYHIQVHTRVGGVGMLM